MGQLRNALLFSKKASELERKLNDKYDLCFVLKNYGNAYASLAKYDSSLAFNLESLNLAEEIKDNLMATDNCNTISAIYAFSGNYEKSIEFGERAHTLYKKIEHQVDASSRDTTLVCSDTVALNDSDPVLVLYCGVFRVTEAFSIEGYLGYYSELTYPVDKAIVFLTGGIIDHDTSDAEENYEFNELTSGNYTVKPTKQNNDRDVLGAFDASFVLRYIAGLINISPTQKIAADVTGNCEVTAYDASYILRRVVGSIDSFPAGDWDFVPDNYILTNDNWCHHPDSINYFPLQQSHVNQDYAGILIGDVFDNWKDKQPPAGQMLAQINFG